MAATTLLQMWSAARVSLLSCIPSADFYLWQPSNSTQCRTASLQEQQKRPPHLNGGQALSYFNILTSQAVLLPRTTFLAMANHEAFLVVSVRHYSTKAHTSQCFQRHPATATVQRNTAPAVRYANHRQRYTKVTGDRRVSLPEIPPRCPARRDYCITASAPRPARPAITPRDRSTLVSPA
jgi:hypothetical protein